MLCHGGEDYVHKYFPIMSFAIRIICTPYVAVGGAVVAVVTGGLLLWTTMQSPSFSWINSTVSIGCFVHVSDDVTIYSPAR